MNSARGFYKFLIFLIFIFVFLSFLPQKRVVLAACRQYAPKRCGSWWWGYGCLENRKYSCDGSDQFWCDQYEGYCVTSYLCDCDGGDCCGGGGGGDFTPPECQNVIPRTPTGGFSQIRLFGFEAGEPGWNIFNGGVHTRGGWVAPAFYCCLGYCAARPPHSGSNLLFLGLNGGAGSATYQINNVTQNHVYRVSVWGMGSSCSYGEPDDKCWADVSAYLTAESGGVTKTTRVAGAVRQPSWEQGSVTIWARSNTLTLTLQAKGSHCWNWSAGAVFDDVTVEELPTSACSSQNCLLEVYATDNKSVQEMRFSNDKTNWTAWEGYEPVRLNYTLGANGQVWAQFKDGAGNESTVSDACSGTCNLGNPPEIISLSPTSVQRCPGGDTVYFTAKYKDIDGLSNIRYAQLIIDEDADWSESPYSYFRGLYAPNNVAGWDEPTAGKFYLYRRWGYGGRNWDWGGGASVGFLENDYVMLDVTGSSVFWDSGTKELTIKWGVRFKSLFPKNNLNSYLFVDDMLGMQDTVQETPPIKPSNIEIVSGFYFHKMGTVDTRCGTITGNVYQNLVGQCSGTQAPSNTAWTVTCAGVTANKNINTGQFTCVDSFGRTQLPYSTYVIDLNSPVGWTVLTGASCQQDPTSIILNSPSKIITPPFYLWQLQDAWFRTEGGDAYARDDIDSDIPSTCVAPCDPNFSLSGSGGYPGVISYNTGSAGFHDGYPSNSTDNHWLANASAPNPYSYAYFEKLLGEVTFATAGDVDGITDPESGNTYFYKFNNGQTFDDAKFSQSGSGIDGRIVVLINGSLTIRKNIRVKSGGFLAFIVNQNIIIDPDVTFLDGAYIANGSISTGTKGSSVSDKLLTGEGMFITGTGDFSLQRDYRDGTNNTEPAELFVFRPALWINSPQELWEAPFTWQEVAP